MFPTSSKSLLCAGGNTVHWNKEGKRKYTLHVSLQVFSTFPMWYVVLTQDEWQLMLVFLAVRAGDGDSACIFY